MLGYFHEVFLRWSEAHDESRRTEVEVRQALTSDALPAHDAVRHLMELRCRAHAYLDELLREALHSSQCLRWQALLSPPIDMPPGDAFNQAAYRSSESPAREPLQEVERIDSGPSA